MNLVMSLLIRMCWVHHFELVVLVCFICFSGFDPALLVMRLCLKLLVSYRCYCLCWSVLLLFGRACVFCLPSFAAREVMKLKKLPERVVAQKKKLIYASRRLYFAFFPNSQLYWSIMYHVAQEELLAVCDSEGITLEEACGQKVNSKSRKV